MYTFKIWVMANMTQKSFVCYILCCLFVAAGPPGGTMTLVGPHASLSAVAPPQQQQPGLYLLGFDISTGPRFRFNIFTVFRNLWTLSQLSTKNISYICPSESFGHHGFGSGKVLLPVQHQAYCLSQCWLVICKVSWHSHESNFIGNPQDINNWNVLENYLLDPLNPREAGDIIVSFWNCWHRVPPLFTDTAKFTGPRTLADKRGVGPVKLLCIIMFDISKIRPKSILGPVEAQNFARCLCSLYVWCEHYNPKGIGRIVLKFGTPSWLTF